MTYETRQIIALDTEPDPEGLAIRTGKLRLLAEDRHVSKVVTLLDTFDREVLNSGRVLLRGGPKLLLLDAGGSLIRQRSQRRAKFVRDFPEGPVRDALQRISRLRALLALGEGDISLRGFALVDSEDKTRARLSLLTLCGVGGSVSLAFLSGLRGYRGAFRTLQGLFHGGAMPDAGLAQSVVSVLAPDLAPYTSKPRLSIAPDERVFDAATRMISALIEVARANETWLAADVDTEFLHDYRVALRKIRSILSLIKGVYSDSQSLVLKGAFGEHMARTGRLRDLDVYLLEKSTYFELVPVSLHEGLAAMFDALARERKRELRKLARYIGSGDYHASMTELTWMFSNPSALHLGPNGSRKCRSFARELIWKRYHKVRGLAKCIDSDTANDKVHRLRLQCKRLRYLLELFASLFPRDAMSALVKQLKQLQDVLGLFNDYSVQQETLREFSDTVWVRVDRDRLVRGESMQVVQAIGALIAVLHQRQLEQRALVDERVERFNGTDVQTEFARLFRD